MLIEEDETILEDDEYDDEKTASYHTQGKINTLDSRLIFLVSISDLLLQFEQQFLEPILESLNMGSAHGAPLSYPYIFATEIYEILCVATYFDSTGTSIPELFPTFSQAPTLNYLPIPPYFPQFSSLWDFQTLFTKSGTNLFSCLTCR